MVAVLAGTGGACCDDDSGGGQASLAAVSLGRSTEIWNVVGVEDSEFSVLEAKPPDSGLIVLGATGSVVAERVMDLEGCQLSADGSRLLVVKVSEFRVLSVPELREEGTIRRGEVVEDIAGIVADECASAWYLFDRRGGLWRVSEGGSVERVASTGCFPIRAVGGGCGGMAALVVGERTVAVVRLGDGHVEISVELECAKLRPYIAVCSGVAWVVAGSEPVEIRGVGMATAELVESRVVIDAEAATLGSRRGGRRLCVTSGSGAGGDARDVVVQAYDVTDEGELVGMRTATMRRRRGLGVCVPLGDRRIAFVGGAAEECVTWSVER